MNVLDSLDGGLIQNLYYQSDVTKLAWLSKKPCYFQEVFVLNNLCNVIIFSRVLIYQIEFL